MNTESLHNLIEKYFDAQTSPEEETLLLKESLSFKGEDPLIDEVLAVMGYARIKHLSAKASLKNGMNKKMKSSRMSLVMIAASMAVFLMVGASVFFTSRSVLSVPDECYAYVNGDRTENELEIRSIVAAQMSEMGDADNEIEGTIAGDLHDFRNAFNDNETNSSL